LTTNNISIPDDVIGTYSLKLEVPYIFKVYRRDYDDLGNKITYEKKNGRGTYYVKEIQK